MTPTNIQEYCRFEFTVLDGFGIPIQIHRVINYDGDDRFGMNSARTEAFEVLGALEKEHGKGNIKCIMKEDDLD